jgi:hypothetical protein
MAEPRPWAPANNLEAGLVGAIEAGDPGEFLRRLAAAELLLPVDESVVPDGEPVVLPAVEVNGEWCVPLFTSPEAMLAGTGGQVRDCTVAPLRDLLAGWPDLDCGLLLNPLTPLQQRFTAADLLTVAGWPVGDGEVFQKFLSVREALSLLQGGQNLISGYAMRFAETKHFTGYDSLVAGLRLTELVPGVTAGTSIVFAVRWVAVGTALYRVPYDGELASATGFLAGVRPAVRLYQVQAVRLPHGSELVQISADDLDRLVATYDTDRGGWVWHPGFIEALEQEAEE